MTGMRRVPVSRSALVLAGLSIGVGIAGWAAQPSGPTHAAPLIRPVGPGTPDDLPPAAPGQVEATAVGQPGVTQGTLRHCSIVGAVRYPGTYAAREQSVLLRSLIEHAGGLTDHAAGTVRILQNGRQQQLVWSPDAPPVIVPPESVVVIDSARSGAHVSLDDVSEYTDIACIHLLQRPVVLWLKPADATLHNLLQLLGQPAGAVESVEVIPPPAGRGLMPEQLASGTVLVFNPAGIDRSSLEGVLQRWPLQDLITIDETIGAGNGGSEIANVLRFLQNGMSAATVEPVLEVTPDHWQAAGSPSRAAVTTASAETATAPLLAPPRRSLPDNTAAPPAPIGLSNTPAALLPAAVEIPADTATERTAVQPASAMQLQTYPETGPSPRLLVNESTAAEAADPIGRTPRERPQRAVQMTSTSPRGLPGTESAPQAGGNVLLSGLVLGLLSGLGTMLTWSRITRRRTRRAAERVDAESHATTEPRLTSQPSTLDALINNTAAVVEEPAVFQGAPRFHGRTVGFRYLLRHGPHALQGPHFAAVENRRRSAEPVMSSAQTRRPSAVETSRFERIDAPAARAVQSEPTPVPRRAGVSPLEQALRSLMRDGRRETAE